MRTWTAVILGAGMALGCSHQKKEVARVDDSGLSRLNESQMAPVDEARIEEGRARDALARARSNEAEARAHFDVARSERQVVEAQYRRSVAERDLLKKQYADRDALARAENDISAAEQRIKACDLKLSYLQQLIAVAESDRKAAEAHVDTAQSQVELAKYKAMKQANVPHVQDFNGAELEQRVAAAQSREASLKQEAASRRAKATDLHNRWEQMDARARTLARPENLPVPPPSGEPTK